MNSNGNNHKWIFIVAILTCMIILSACVGDQATESSDSGNDGDDDTYTFKVSHVVQESHVWNAIAEKFGEELEKRSDGRMDLEIYPASQLGDEQDMVQQLSTGSLDFGFLTNAYMSTREESLNAWFQPFLFDDLEEAVKMRDSDEAKEMLSSLESQDLIGLDFAFAGNRHVLLKDGFVESPEDLEGKKLRIIGSPLFQSFWEEVGAGPTAMPLSEVYTSLQTGVIDGMDIDLDALVTEKYYENAEYLTLTDHATFPTVIVMSKPIFDKLSEDDQEIVKNAMTAAVDWGIDEAIKREKNNLETLKDEGVKVQELKDKSSFDSTSQKIRDNFSEKSDVIKSFIESIEEND